VRKGEGAAVRREEKVRKGAVIAGAISRSANYFQKSGHHRPGYLAGGGLISLLSQPRSVRVRCEEFVPDRNARIR